MSQIIATGKTNHCGRCHRQRMFWRVPGQPYKCEKCGLSLVELEQVRPVSEAGFAAYKAEIDAGRDTAVAAEAAARAREATLLADYEDTIYSFEAGTGRR